MKVTIRTKDVRFSMPVPIPMVSFVVRMIPDRIFKKLQAYTPAPYYCLVTKQYISMILEECVDILKENKDLECIHVESTDGTFISIKL